MKTDRGRIRKRALFEIFPGFLFLAGLMSGTGWSETYQYVSQWGIKTSSSQVFLRAEGVAVDASGNIYVVDTINYCIQKVDPNGNFINKWGSYGSGDGQFIYPEGVTIDASGNVYVVDIVNHNIQKFDSNGNLVTQWGSSGSGNGQFSYSTGKSEKLVSWK